MSDHLSVSQITGYLQCPRKYAFRYVLQRPPEFQSAALSFGKAIHSALASYHESGQKGKPITEAEVHALFRADWEAETILPLRFGANESAETLQSLGETLLSEYLRDPIQNVTASEEPFELLLSDLDTGELLADEPLVGILDVRTETGFFEFKTAKTPIAEAILARHLQLSAYAYAYHQIHGSWPIVTVVHLLKLKRPRVERQEIERTERDVKFFLNCAAQVAQAIDTGLFPPNPSWACLNCEYGKACLVG